MRITFHDGTEMECKHCGMDMPMLYITPQEPMTMLEAAQTFTPDRMVSVSCDYGSEVVGYEGFTLLEQYHADMYTGNTCIGFRKEVVA